MMNDIEIEENSGNIFADIGFADAAKMQLKAKLALSLHKIIGQEKLSHKNIAGRVGLTQLELSSLLRGRFKGISEGKMIQCLAALGCDIDIVIKLPQHVKREGRLEVVYKQ